MRAPFLVIAAGAHGSGSTWLFNTLRFIFVNARQRVYSDFVDNYAPVAVGEEAEVHVVKAHVIPPFGHCARHLFWMQRDLRDCLASEIRRGLIEATPEAVIAETERMVREECIPWEAATPVRYEDMRRDERQVIAGLIEAVGLTREVRPIPVQADVAKLRLMAFPDRDRTTQLWPRHVGDGQVGGYARFLSPELIAAVEAAGGEWLEAHGYAVTR